MKPPSAIKQLLKVLRRLAPYLAVLVFIILGYNGCVNMLVSRWDEKAPRNPETGILVGAEPLDLGPEDADAAVLLVHGFIGGSSNFNTLPQRLANEGYRVRAMLLPGHGTSPRDFAETPAEAFIPAILDEYRVLDDKFDQVFLVGHSMGGALCVLAASIENPAGLVLAAPYFGVSYQWYYGLPVETWHKLSSPLIRWVYKSDGFIRVKNREEVSNIFSYRWVPAKASETLMKFGELARDPITLGEITCPVLMFHGRDDHAADPERAATAFEAIGSADKRLVWLENSDHHIFWDYEHGMVEDDIIAFLQNIRISANIPKQDVGE